MTKHQWKQKHSPMSLGWLHSYKNLEKEKRRLEVIQKLLNSMWLTGYTTVQMFRVSKFLFVRKLITITPQRSINLIKSNSKDIYYVTKDFCFK